jgi:hypothetical protein
MSLSNSPSPAFRKNRFPTSLNRRLDHKLFGYTAAASAAGVGMMALAQPSQAEIVYTPTNQTVAVNQTVAIDLNNDGIADFNLRNVLFAVTGANHHGGAFPTGGGSQVVGYVSAVPPAGNHVMRTASYYASALLRGGKIGRGGKWNTAGAMEACSSVDGVTVRLGGPWNDVKARYLGLAFVAKGHTHLGWARLNVSHSGCQMTAVLTGYAYETVPGKTIAAGRTSGTDEVTSEQRPQATLGALALGSVGLVAWRRDEDEG